MFVLCLYLVLLRAGLTAAFLLQPNGNISKLNCRSLCGVPPAHVPNSTNSQNRDQSTGHSTGPSNIQVNFSGDCVRESPYSIGDWEKSAGRFLRLINMNDTSLGCPTWNRVFREPTEAEIPRFADRLRRSSRNVRKPAGNSGTCHIEIDRGVVKRDFHIYWMNTDLSHTADPLVTAGSLVSLWLLPWEYSTDYVPFLVQVQQNKSNRCRGEDCPVYEKMWLPASTFGTSVPYTADTTKQYSIFAKWNFQQIPGVDGLMDKFRDRKSHLSNVVDELSPSNIAILSLPLLMAIPPISLLEQFSSMATAWYVFATDILATLPLLIKGIELVIAHPRSTVRMYSTLSMIGSKYGVYERWYLECRPPEGVTGRFGIVLISIALWFMIASSFCEFAFWRALQYRQGRLEKVDEITSEVKVNESKSSDSENRKNSFCTRFRIQILACAFLGLIALFISAPISQSTTVYIVAVFALVVYRLYATNRFPQLLQYQFLFGIIFGFVGGPLYLIMHVKKNVRESNEWGGVADSANIGMAVLGALATTRIRDTFPFHLAFAWLYGAAIIVLHAVRSLPNDKVRWRYGLNGFAAGTLFGPFGIFFKRCYPETNKYEQARANFHGGFCFGVIFLLTVINIVHWTIRHANYRHRTPGLQLHLK